MGCVTTNLTGPTLEDLLQRSAWARRLARHLVRRRADADDLLQEAWLAAAAKGEVPSRPWLSAVLRVLGMNQARAAGRRRQRETEAVAARGATSEAPGPDELLTQVETQHRLSEALLALDEPYRTTVLLRYYEELPAAEIARRTRVPAGTVRWRLKEGLGRLRLSLNDQAARRDSFAVALITFAHGPVRAGLARFALPGGLVAAVAGVAGLVALQLSGSGQRSPAPFVDHAIRTSGAQTAPGKESDMKIATAIGALAVAASLAMPAASGTAAASATPALPASRVPRYQVPLGVGPIQGPVTARVTILAFMDYQSPMCLRASRTMDAVLAAHPGKLRYQVIHRPLPFHRHAVHATRAAFAAAQQGKFWELHTMLMENQTALEPADIEGYAKKLGLDLDRFRADIVGSTVTNQVDLEDANSQSVKIAAVPTFFLNGRLIGGAQPLPVFQQAVAEELAHANALLDAGVAASDLYATITRQGAPELPGPSPFAGDPVAKEGQGMAAFHATQKLLGDNVALANACFETGRSQSPGLAGRVVVDVKLASDQPPRLQLNESTVNSAKVDNCILQALRKLPYPELKSGGPIVARRQFAYPPDTREATAR
jgi:RNA polymerase sigma factor (sigma-70 family)